MISKTIETFELNEIETKTLSDFQNVLIQMRDCAVKQDTQSKIESIYTTLITLIPEV